MAGNAAAVLERETHGWVRVAALSPRLRLGAVAENGELTRRAVAGAVADGARVVVLPELGLTGYSCGDLFHQSAVLGAAEAALGRLLEASQDWAALIVVGLPVRVEDRLYNAAAVISGGQLLGVVPKTFLPTSAEFYERRWFSPGATLTAPTARLAGQVVPMGTDLLFEAAALPRLRLGVELCEDLWAVIPPSSRAALAGANLVVNLSASNELLGKLGYRRELVRQQSARCLAGYAYASAGVGESSTDVVYSGHCMIAENGVMRAESVRFEWEGSAAMADVDLQWLEHERFLSAAFRDEAGPARYRRVVADWVGGAATGPECLRRLSSTPFVPPAGVDRAEACREIFEIQATGLARRLEAAGAKTAVIGVSGGLDSTLALLVAMHAMEKLGRPSTDIVAVTMPGLGTSDRTWDNALALAQALAVTLRQIPIAAAVRQHFEDIGHPADQHDVVYENAQARERTQILMDVANQVKGIVVGTGDLSEAALGWCTFNGDHMSMYHVNAGVPKTLVRYLIGWCAEEPYAAAAGATLLDIIDTPISPELLPLSVDQQIAQRTEDVVGPYELHDFFLFHLVRHGASPAKIRFLARHAFVGHPLAEQVERWLPVFLKRFAQSQFKRSVMPDGPKVGTVALSPRGDWRMPSDWMGELDSLEAVAEVTAPGE